MCFVDKVPCIIGHMVGNSLAMPMTASDSYHFVVCVICLARSERQIEIIDVHAIMLSNV